MPPAHAATSPREWDPRVATIAEEVERLRGLQFDHPVPVKVLDSADFDRRYTKDQALTKKDREEWAESEAALRALGLLDDPIDLETLRNDIGAQVLGFYDPARGQIVVRGDAFDSPATRATLAHELTHALQDQEFGLKQLRKRERKAEVSSVSALVEGDASRIGQQYESGLSRSDRDEIAGATDSSVAAAPDLPPIVSVSLASRYTLGLVMTNVLAAAGGNQAVNDAFRDPPLNDLALVDPAALVAGTEALRARDPELEPGDTRLGDTTPMGAWMLYFVLASHLPPAESLRIAQRWGGDSSVAFTRDGSKQCMASVMVGRDGADDATTLADGLERWNTAAGADAVITRRATEVRITACAPDTPLAVSEAALNQALFHVILRNNLTASILQSGFSPPAATCVADGIMDVDAVEDAIATVQSADDDVPSDFQATLQSAIQANVGRLRNECQQAR